MLNNPFDRFRLALLHMWKDTWRYTDIQAALKTLAPHLLDHFPLERVLIRQFDTSIGIVKTVAEWETRSTPLDHDSPTNLGYTRLKKLAEWARQSLSAEILADRRTGPVAWMIPAAVNGDVLVAPLQGSDDLLGAMVLVATPGTTFGPLHQEFATYLSETFAAAWDNAECRKELGRLRALAEAAAGPNGTGPDHSGRDAIVGADGGLRQVMDRVQLVSQSDVPVLILGETGTGKEVISRAIHTRSSRGAEPFIRVNCGAIPPELIDSQLFGHEKGSFTGAADTRKGWFERADRGTLFLDEVGELPLPAQVRLLRVLQDGYVERVGGQQAIKVNVRIIAATHRDLAAMVRTNSFREDLWYRINVFPIVLPRLEERLDDIPHLARHFAQRAAQRFGLPYVEPTPADYQVLLNYSWPGNIRELAAVIDRAAILGEGKCLEVAKALGLSVPPAPPPAAAPTLYEVTTDDIRGISPAAVSTLEIAMRQHIERALIATQGRIEGKHGTAALLGINPHTLRARMRKLGIKWSRFRGM